MKIPFDIKYRPQIESGEYKVETEAGSPAKVIDWEYNSRVCGKCIAIKITEGDGDQALLYTHEGKRASIFPAEEGYDLFLVTPEPELSEFEEKVKQLIGSYPCTNEENKGSLLYEVRKAAAELLAIATEELKKTFVLLHKDDYQTAFDLGKAEALKDLPRWEKYSHNAGREPFVNGILQKDGLYKWRLYLDCYKIEISDLEKLPGFKEDESHE